MGFWRGFDQGFAWGAEGIWRRDASGGGRGNRRGTRGMEVSWEGSKEIGQEGGHPPASLRYPPAEAVRPSRSRSSTG